MQLTRKIIIYCLLCSLSVSCIDPYKPDSSGFEPMVFIQASLTDDPSATPTVELSTSFPLNDDYIGTMQPDIILYGANVYIERDDGLIYPFVQSSGFNSTIKYVLPDPDFELVNGKSYRLIIETSDNKRFESEYEYYLPGDPIDSITYKYSQKPPSDIGFQDAGYKFYVSTSSDRTEPAYYRWDVDATYRFMVPFLANYYWDGTEMIDSLSYDIKLCYKNQNIKDIFIGSTAGLIENRIVDLPLNYVSRYGYALQIEYSLHARQYRISPGAFSFWSDLRTLLYETGGLYETQPFRISGNISCTSDPTLNVAGIFEVSGVTESRIFVSGPYEFSVITETCTADTLGTPNFPWERLSRGSWIIEADEGLYLTSDLHCFDCTLSGGYVERPPFWEK